MNLRKLACMLITIPLILLLLFIVVAPIATVDGTPNNHGNGNGNGAPSPGGGYDPGSGSYAGKFMVNLCGSYGSYSWVEPWQYGKTLAGPVSKVGTCYSSSGTTYKLEIPAGTVIEGYYAGQGRVNFLEIKCIGGELYFTPNLKLSQPATLYKLVDGEWIKVLTFTQVVDGKAS